MIRVCVYVDGYNLYHAIDGLKNDSLKWLDLKALTQHFLDPAQHSLKEIYYFSAYATWKSSAFKRHKIYVRALEAIGVKPIMGKFKEKSRSCRECKTKWVAHEEKETDVNIALFLLNDAYQDKYDEAIIISQDSDLFPAVEMIKKHFPHKSIKIITPPNLHHSKEMTHVIGKKKLGKIKPIHLERSLLPALVKTADGKHIKRPEKYDPK